MNSKELFLIEGLAGEKKLKGRVSINGAKNAALKAMAAAVLFKEPVKLENIPDTDDIHTLTEILKKMGATVTWTDSEQGKYSKMTIDTSDISSTDIDKKMGAAMRASVVLTGPLLARFGNVTLPSPGGCVIGARPIDQFIEGYEKMGAKTIFKDGVYEMKSVGDLKGGDILFSKVTVGGTETLMMVAVLAHGKTYLSNCAMEPEIVNVAEWLNACGAKIKGAGTPTMEIEGRGGELLEAKTPFVTIPDRIEAGSFLILGALCCEELIIENCRPDHLKATIDLLKGSGVNLEVRPPDSGMSDLQIRVFNDPKKNTVFKTFNICTREYPYFPTDLQSPIVTFLTQAEGECSVDETIFEGRFKYVDDLIKMGADIKVMNSREIEVKGPTLLKELKDGGELCAHDIRAGFAVVLAALVGKGKFKVNNVHLIDRGYEKLEERLRGLGARIERVRR